MTAPIVLRSRITLQHSFRTNDAEMALRALDTDAGTRVRGNVKLIDEWLDAICDAHIADTKVHDQFPVGASITSKRMQEEVLGCASNDIKTFVEAVETNKTEEGYHAVASFQLLLLTHYLLRRCGVNCLRPEREEWGFDMFQALNTTGTPLTVIETFLPKVMQAELALGNEWEKTLSCEYMDEAQELFDVTTTNEQKNRRTNELLGTFALCYEGKKLGNKFSEQRKWLAEIYEKKLPSISEKHEFLKKLSKIANFFYFGWYMEEMTIPNYINGLKEEYADGELASFLIRYLRDANSKLSAPILARFYSQAVEDQTLFHEFIESVKACASFFTLWRSANSTAGLDSIYRKYFKGSNASVAVNKHNWKEHPAPLTARSLKQYFVDILKNEGITGKNEWIEASERFLLYTELKAICRFVLFLATHDRVADMNKPGLTEAGTKGSCELLNLGRWKAKEHKSLEHVAPQNPPTGHNWDTDIYANGLVHQVGNLMLLPLDLNKFGDNKAWAVKYLHYCHVGERNQKKLTNLKNTARKKGIVLSQRAIDAFGKMKYDCAVEPILSVGESGKWDANLVKERTRHIKEIAWDTLFSWLKL